MRQRKVSTVNRAGALVALTAVAAAAGLVTPAAASASSTVVVHPGQSVQAAIDAAPDGATVVLAPGTYRENLLVAHRITLRGQPGAVLTRSDVPAGSVCNGDQEAADAGLSMQVGICVVGELGTPVPGDGDLPTVMSPVDGVRIEGLALVGFDEGVESVGTTDLRLQDLAVRDSRDSGVLAWYGDHTVLQGLTISGGEGFAAASVRRSSSLRLTGNRITGNAGAGVALADDTGGTVTGNVLEDNAAGLVAWDSGDLGRVGDMADVTIAGNRIARNSRAFNPGGGPGFGAVGVALFGTTNVTVSGNAVRDNGPANVDDSPLTGFGIGLFDADMFGGAAASGNRVTGNSVTGSDPALVDATTGSNLVQGNHSQP
jgi:parallel beta-helix repeat protein